MKKNRFRKGERVSVGSSPDSYRTGTVINPNMDQYGTISVRMDHQLPHENGYRYLESSVSPCTTGETQYNLRCFNFMGVPTPVVTALRKAIDGLPIEPEEDAKLRAYFYNPQGYQP